MFLSVAAHWSPFARLVPVSLGHAMGDDSARFVELGTIGGSANLRSVQIKAGAVQLVECHIEKPSAVLTWVRVPSEARHFSPRVNFHCRLFLGCPYSPCVQLYPSTSAHRTLNTHEISRIMHILTHAILMKYHELCIYSCYNFTSYFCTS